MSTVVLSNVNSFFGGLSNDPVGKVANVTSRFSNQLDEKVSNYVNKVDLKK